MITKMIFVLAAVLMLFTAGSASAEEAQDITKQCAITLNGKRFTYREMVDRKYSTYTKIAAGKGVVIDGKGQEISGVFLQFYDRATPVEIQIETAGGWATVEYGGDHLTDWFPVPEGTTRMRVLNASKARLFLAEMTVYGAGDRPANAARWEDCDKADMMVLVGHPDDELLWFGGLLPTYAGERGLNVVVAYAVPSTPLRRLELLDGLWHCGVKAYPAFLGMRDVRTKSAEAQYKMWGKNKFLGAVTEAIRKYRPDVLVTQDFAGEYGHGAHRAVADAAVKCAEYAAQADKFPASAKTHGTWQPKKVYVHLYDKNQLRMDWHMPLDAFGGKDGMQVATEALACHASQVKHGWAMTEGGATDNTLFGLYYSSVGEDEAGNDLMEHIVGEGETDV